MDVYDAMFRMVSEHQLDVRGKRIVLKPNLVEYDENTVTNAHPVVVHAAFEAFRKLGAADVRIAEGPGHSAARWIWPMRLVISALGRGSRIRLPI